MAQDAFDLDQHLNGLGNNDGDWPARFSDSVRTGREIPALNDETRFRVAIRWALAVLEDWPAHRDGRVIVFEAPEVVVFAARFFDGDPIRGWRAAAYLAVEERGLFEALLKHVHGIRLGQRRIPITAALASQHGLDHLVAMVGAKTVGKTSFLLSLAEAGILEYRQVNGDTGWLTIDAADPPRSSWRDNFQFDTLPSNHLNMQGREARVTEGLRLIAYDAAGETVAFGNVGDGREYDTFFKVLSPSALIFIVSSVDKLNPKDANENAITAVSEIIDGNPEFPRDIPVFILFNKADTWFDERDERRSTLLGPQSVLLDAATLDGSGEFKGLSSLLQALETDEFMAANPLEGSAYTQALTEFGTCIDPVLQRFRRVVFGFMCCLGGAAGDSLRLSNQVIWQSLRAIIKEATRDSRRLAVRRMFVDEVAEDVKALQELRLFGAKLEALNSIEGDVGEIASEVLKQDWLRLQATTSSSEFDLALQEVERPLRRFVAELTEVDPVPALSRTDSKLGWLLASLGVKHDLFLPRFKQNFDDSVPSGWSDDGWTKPIEFSPVYTIGARTIPSDWEDENAHAALLRVAKENGFNRDELAIRVIAKLMGQESKRDELLLVLRLLTHTVQYDDPGAPVLFASQVLRLGDPDPYAYAAVATTALRFKKLSSLARSIVHAANVLAHAPAAVAAVVDESDSNGAPTTLAAAACNAYRFQLLRLALGHVPTPQDFDLSRFAAIKEVFISPTTPQGRLNLKLRPVLRDLEKSSFLKRLQPLRDVGEHLQLYAAERFEGYMHSRLSNAIASGWFAAAEPQLLTLERLLEYTQKRPTEWRIWDGKVDQGRATGNYKSVVEQAIQRIFESQ